MTETGWWDTLFSGVPVDTSVRAFLTTIHCALLVLRQQRPRGNAFLVLLPSLLFVAFPWLLPTPFWLLTVLAAHVAWFSVTERLLPQPASGRPAVATPKSQNAAAAAPTAKSPSPPSGFQQLRVLAVFEETPEIRTFRLARPQGFTFTPGQFLMVKAVIDGKPLVRCYSISSCPSARGYLEISVRKQGAVSAWLHEQIRAGGSIEAQGPGGTFVYPEGSRPIVLIAGGIGITPLLSMLRHALACEPLRAVTLLLSARTEPQIPFRHDLKLLAHRHPNFKLAIALSGGSATNGYHSGRINSVLLKRVISDPPAATYLMCGPLPMIDECRTMLESLGVAAGEIHFERFEAAAAAAQANAGTEPIKVSLTASRCELTLRSGESILDAAESAGVMLPSMCRAGVCGTCVARLVEGEVDGDFGHLDETGRQQGQILVCVARPRTDCVIDA